MRNYFLLLFLFLVNFIGYAQYDCGWYGTMTTEECRQQFPFNGAKKVVLVSYSNLERAFNHKTGESIFVPDSATLKEASKILEGIVLNKRTVTNSNLKRVYFTREEVVLSESEISELSMLLVNFKSRGKGIGDDALCYEPRNAILFLDENNDVIASIEICFQCLRISLIPDGSIDYEFNRAMRKLIFLKLSLKSMVFHTALANRAEIKKLPVR